MNKWAKRIRGALGMGATWAIGWAVFGLLIGVSSLLLPGLPWNAFFEFYDAPLPTLGVPGFVGGVLFSVILGTAAQRRTLDDLSIPRFAAWGAVAGLTLSAIPDTMVLAGMATRSETAPALGTLTAILAPPLTLLCALSASGSLLLARRARRREWLQARQSLGLGARKIDELSDAALSGPFDRLPREASQVPGNRS